MRPKRLLLDTHAFLWWRADDPRLGAAAREAIAVADLVHLSAASVWEAGIKIRLGRLRLPEPFAKGVADSGFSELPIRFAHAERAAELPPHHGDPFDRLLVSQALAEPLRLVTADKVLVKYGDLVTLV